MKMGISKNSDFYTRSIYVPFLRYSPQRFRSFLLKHKELRSMIPKSIKRAEIMYMIGL
jgi:hypothetical protein